MDNSICLRCKMPLTPLAQTSSEGQPPGDNSAPRTKVCPACAASEPPAALSPSLVRYISSQIAGVDAAIIAVVFMLLSIGGRWVFSTYGRSSIESELIMRLYYMIYSAVEPLCFFALAMTFTAAWIGTQPDPRDQRSEVHLWVRGLFIGALVALLPVAYWTLSYTSDRDAAMRYVLPAAFLSYIMFAGGLVVQWMLATRSAKAQDRSAKWIWVLPFALVLAVVPTARDRFIPEILLYISNTEYTYPPLTIVAVIGLVLAGGWAIVRRSHLVGLYTHTTPRELSAALITGNDSQCMVCNYNIYALKGLCPACATPTDLRHSLRNSLGACAYFAQLRSGYTLGCIGFICSTVVALMGAVYALGTSESSGRPDIPLLPMAFIAFTLAAGGSLFAACIKFTVTHVACEKAASATLARLATRSLGLLLCVGTIIGPIFSLYHSLADALGWNPWSLPVIGLGHYESSLLLPLAWIAMACHQHRICRRVGGRGAARLALGLSVCMVLTLSTIGVIHFMILNTLDSYPGALIIASGVMSLVLALMNLAAAGFAWSMRTRLAPLCTEPPLPAATAST
jgi:hypothetical protein